MSQPETRNPVIVPHGDLLQVINCSVAIRTDGFFVRTTHQTDKFNSGGGETEIHEAFQPFRNHINLDTSFDMIPACAALLEGALQAQLELIYTSLVSAYPGAMQEIRQKATNRTEEGT